MHRRGYHARLAPDDAARMVRRYAVMVVVRGDRLGAVRWIIPPWWARGHGKQAASGCRGGLPNDGAAHEVHPILPPVELPGVDEARNTEDSIALDRETPAGGGLRAEFLRVCPGEDLV